MYSHSMRFHSPTPNSALYAKDIAHICHADDIAPAYCFDDIVHVYYSCYRWREDPNEMQYSQAISVKNDFAYKMGEV